MSNNRCPRCGMLALIRQYEQVFCLLCGNQRFLQPVAESIYERKPFKNDEEETINGRN